LEPGWDSYDGPVPSPESVTTAQRILGFLENTDLRPERVLASADGGTAIVFISPTDRRAFIEVTNHEGTQLVLYDLQGNCQTLPWLELEQSECVTLLRQHLHGGKHPVTECAWNIRTKKTTTMSRPCRLQN
jgi:hypothetical protein